jgi:hypothetical protein
MTPLHFMRNALLCTLIYVAALSPVPAAPGQNSQPKVADTQSKARIVHFPNDRSIGRIYLVQRQTLAERNWHYVFGWVIKKLGDARGDVKVPADGMLRLDVIGDAWQKTQPFIALEPNDIQMLNLYNCDGVGDYLLSQIDHLSGLEVLFLHESNLTPKGLRYIKNFKNLKALAIPDYVQSKELSFLQELPSIEYLNFAGPMVNDEKLSIIGKLTWLTQLSIGGSEVSTGLAHLKNLKSLRYLNLAALRNLNLDRDLSYIAALTDLEELDLQDAMVNDNGLVHLSKLHKLRRLNLLKTSPSGKITDSGLAHLKHLQSLVDLQIPSGITDIGIEHLAKLDLLKKVNLWGDGITDKSMAALSKMKSLETLDISSRNITDAGMEQLARCPNLKSLSLQNTPITNVSLTHLAKLKTLNSLNFWNTKITGKSLSALKEITQLTNLSFLMENLNEDFTSYLTELKTLETLRLQYLGFNVKDENLAHLSNLTSLKNLSITVREPNRILITNAGMAHLLELKSLENLYINDCQNITDEGLKYFECLTSLKDLRLDKSKVTMAGVARLKQKIPGVIVTVPCTMQAYQAQQKTTRQPPLRK